MVTMSMQIGGAETHILELAKGLKKRGIEVHVASAGGVFAKELKKATIPHHTLPLDRREIFSMLKAQKGLKKLLLREKYDIVHAHARIPAFLCGNLRKTMHFRFITTDHLDFELTPLLKKLTNWGEYTIAVSEDLKNYLLTHFDLNPEHISLTVNGIDTERFSPTADGSACRKALSAEGKAVILHISRLDTPVCHCASALMDAMLLLDKTAMLVIVGDGDGAEILRKKAETVNKKLGHPAVLLAGAQTDVVPYIAASDIVIAPSRAAMESMACGKPTVIAGSQGYGGIFRKEIEKEAQKSNFCFRGAGLPTAEILANDIRTMLSMSENERKALGANCRRYIEEQYSVDIMVKSQLAVYQKIAPYRTDGTPDILLCGYYGYGNLGDETLLSVIIREIRERKPSARICVLSADPKKTAAYHTVDAIGRFDMAKIAGKMKKGSLFLFGGGSLLQDKTSDRSLAYYVHMLRMAKKHGMKIAVFANGIGPIFRSKNISLVKDALALADSLSFRDTASLAFFKKLLPDRKAVLTFDPAILVKKSDFSPSTSTFSEEKGDFFVAIPKKSVPEHREKLKKAILWTVKTYEITPVMLSLFEEEDGDFTRQLAKETGAEIVSFADAAPCIELLSHSRFLLSARLHGLVYATAALCPMLAYSDDSKLFSYMDTIGFGTKDTISAVLPVGGEKNLEESIAALLKHEDKIREMLKEALPARQQLAESGFDVLMTLLNTETSKGNTEHV